ncbi:MAG: glutamine--fructose-6-phosphate transaminase (isomerizing) [Zetaproteobacteria bacterium]|nr:glutamine--fructose-6-phosphate transaminase (isomerizing) [Zetaproteobacteria bacterium]
MCGIIGYVGKTPCVEFIFEGLKKLEYRGYDSSGIAVYDSGHLHLIKKPGKIKNLQPYLGSLPSAASSGMGHTRWATHGEPSELNAHPHMEQGISVVHNGILENYKELKIELMREGAVFQSDTDTEVMVHLLARELAYVKDPKKAILNIVPRLEGAFAFGIMFADYPDTVYLVKQASPLVVGLGEGESFFASDALALLGHCKNYVYLEDAQIAELKSSGLQLYNFHGVQAEFEVTQIDEAAFSVDKGGFHHYMRKEISEQSRIIAAAIAKYLGPGSLESWADVLDKLPAKGKIAVHEQTPVYIVGCGTAYYAGMLGKYLIESLTAVQVQVELASEFRYRQPKLRAGAIAIAVTQSGETADTLAAVQYAKRQGATVYSLCNVEHSSIVRESEVFIPLGCGAEIGVASTKAFTAMVFNFYLLSWVVASQFESVAQSPAEELRSLPLLLERIQAMDAQIEQVAKQIVEASSCIYMGRGHHFPLACEGALKLKELSYIHAEGYAGGELKHGPIALIDRSMFVVALVPRCDGYDKMVSNIQEVIAREGRVIAVGAEDDRQLQEMVEYYIPSPQVDDPALQAILTAVVLQLFAYYVAVHRGTDVDQPRNLAKSVTVE